VIGADSHPLASCFLHQGDEFVTTQLRLLAGGIALVAGLWLLTGADAAPPQLSKDTYKKAAEADIAQLQKHLATCDGDAKEAKRYGPTAKSLAMILAEYGEATGDKALKDQAIKVGEAIAAKNFKGALDLGKELTAKSSATALPPGGLAKLNKYSLEEVMSPFRGGTVGGLNIEKDIRSLRDGKMAVNAANVEVLAARTGVLMDYASVMPNDKATTNKANTDKWAKYCKDSIDITKKLADEAAKGKKADDKEIIKLIKSLDAKCVDCHKDFRDD
jgi:hypothetical protein